MTALLYGYLCKWAQRKAHSKVIDSQLKKESASDRSGHPGAICKRWFDENLLCGSWNFRVMSRPLFIPVFVCILIV